MLAMRMIGALANTGVKRFAIAYLDDVGPANPQAMKAALTQNNLTAVVEVPLNRNADHRLPEASEGVRC